MYGTGVMGAHKIVSSGLRTPLKMGMILSKGLPILPGGLKLVNRKVRSGLNSGFGLIGSAPRMAARGGAIILSPLRDLQSSFPLRDKRKSPKQKTTKRKSPKRKSSKRK